MSDNIEQQIREEAECRFPIMFDDLTPHRCSKGGATLLQEGYIDGRLQSLSELAAKDAEIASLRAQLSTMQDTDVTDKFHDIEPDWYKEQDESHVILHTTEQVREMLGRAWDEGWSEGWDDGRNEHTYDDTEKETTINNILNSK